MGVMKHGTLYQARLGIYGRWSLPVRTPVGMLTRWARSHPATGRPAGNGGVHAGLGSGKRQAASCDCPLPLGASRQKGSWVWGPPAPQQAQISSGSRVAWVTAGVVTILTQEEITSKGLGVPVG